MQKAIPQDERFDPNRFLMLRLGSPTVTPNPNPSTSTPTTTRSDSQDRVIFADPCSTCGTKKRRSSPRQESNFNPRKKKFLVESASIKDPNPNPMTTATGGTTTLQGSDPLVRSIYGSIPFPLPSSPITSPVPKTSSISSPVATIQRCNSAPPESIPSPNSPVIAFGSIQTPPPPPSQPPVVFRGWINSVSGSPQTSPEISPTNALLPPRPPTLLRSSSAPIPSIMDPIVTIGETVSGTTFLGSPDSVTGTRTGTRTEQSPSQKERWRRMRECLAEIKKWVEEQETHEAENNKSEEIKDVKKGEGYESEDNVTAKRDGGNFSVSYKCCCGRRCHTVVSI